ncbi:hypothetical protein H4W34_004534 [Actinomadura algeriensis]|uniref:DUF397 domain-containing protein n=1 Tax=Actinomadura algeriensis TaxID=1679523 RepID=A0ABR9JVV3_9ACTN|nr:hypothetical protein [Actinomadura algeriensis]
MSSSVPSETRPQLGGGASEGRRSSFVLTFAPLAMAQKRSVRKVSQA